VSTIGEIGMALLAVAVRRVGVPGWAAAAVAVGGFVDTAGFASGTRALVVAGFALVAVGAARTAARFLPAAAAARVEAPAVS
jgi:hypothetical protein